MSFKFDDKSKISGALFILAALVIYVIVPNSGRFSRLSFLLLLFGGYIFLNPFHNSIPSVDDSSQKSALANLGVFLLFGLIVFATQFWYFRDFGLYEVDLTQISSFFSYDKQNFFSQISWHLFQRLSPDSLPLLSTSLFTYIGFSLGGLPGLYLLSMLIPTTISFFFFLIIKNLTEYTLPAYLGAFLFIVFPPFRMPQILQTTLSDQFALLLLLFSLHQFLNAHMNNFRFLTVLTLLFMPEYIPLLLFFPLLKLDGLNRPFFRRWLKHSLEILFLSFIVLTATSLSSNLKVSLTRLELLTEIPSQFIRVFTDKIYNYFLYNFSTSPTSILIDPSTDVIIITLIIFVVFAITGIISSLQNSKCLHIKRHINVDNPLFSLKITSCSMVIKMIKLFLSSLFMLLFVFSGFSRKVYFPFFRNTLTSYYLVAAFPFILCFISLFMVIYLLINRPFLKRLTLIILILFLSLLAADRVITQKKLIKSWKIEQWLWTNIIDQIEVLSEKSYITINTSFDQSLTLYDSNDFSINYRFDLLPFIFVRPETWTTNPVLNFSAEQIVNQSPDDSPSGNDYDQIINLVIKDGALIKLTTTTPTSSDSDTFIPLKELDKKPLYNLLYNEAYKDMPLSEVMVK